MTRLIVRNLPSAGPVAYELAATPARPVQADDAHAVAFVFDSVEPGGLPLTLTFTPELLDRMHRAMDKLFPIPRAADVD